MALAVSGAEDDQESAHGREGGDLRFDHLRHRPDQQNGLVGVHRRDFVPDGLREGGGIRGGFRDEKRREAPSIVGLKHRSIDLDA